jgi:hypothetical protein
MPGGVAGARIYVSAPYADCGAPSMGALLRVKVPPRADHSERSEAQLRKGDRPWRGSVERNCEPMYKNRIEGAAEQGERA